MVVGDLNDYQFSPALSILKTGTADGSGKATLTDLITTLPANQQYTYDFDGPGQRPRRAGRPRSWQWREAMRWNPELVRNRICWPASSGWPWAGRSSTRSSGSRWTSGTSGVPRSRRALPGIVVWFPTLRKA